MFLEEPGNKVRIEVYDYSGLDSKPIFSKKTEASPHALNEGVRLCLSFL